MLLTYVQAFWFVWASLVISKAGDLTTLYLPPNAALSESKAGIIVGRFGLGGALRGYWWARCVQHDPHRRKLRPPRTGGSTLQFLGHWGTGALGHWAGIFGIGLAAAAGHLVAGSRRERSTIERRTEASDYTQERAAA